MNSMHTNQSFAKAMLWLAILFIGYALLLPDNVLTANPALSNAVNLMQFVFPGIGGLANYSPIPEVVRLYYATMWAGFPLLVWWVIKCDLINSRHSPPNSQGIKLVVATLGVIGLFGLIVYFMGFHVPKGSSLRPVATGGRGNALFVGLTANRVSIGFFSMLVFFTLSLLTHAIFNALTFIFKGHSK